MRLPILLLAAAPLLLVPAAQAQWYDGGRGGFGDLPPPPYGYGPRATRILPRDVIVDRLEELGFDDVGRPRLDGDVYTVTATNPSGARVRIAVDAYRGTILRRVGRPAPDGLDEDLVGPGRRGYNQPPEMPSAPGFREPPIYAGRPDFDEPVTPRIAPAPPVEAMPLAAPPIGGRALPADPRLAPSPGPLSEPRREPATPSTPDRPGMADRPGTPGAVYGTNPQPGRAQDVKPQAARPARPAATSPAAPAPGPVEARPSVPAEPKAATAEAEPRRPVRVIPGVTPLNSGGAQATPAPQNNQASKPPQ